MAAGGGSPSATWPNLQTFDDVISGFAFLDEIFQDGGTKGDVCRTSKPTWRRSGHLTDIYLPDTTYLDLKRVTYVQTLLRSYPDRRKGSQIPHRCLHHPSLLPREGATDVLQDPITYRFVWVAEIIFADGFPHFEVPHVLMVLCNHMAGWCNTVSYTGH